MSKFPYMLVDAFTTRPLGGNPCAVFLDADQLDDATMQAIAGEMNLSETSFVQHSSIADFRARYFTPAEEIPLAGHPTIATTHALIDTGRLKLHPPLTIFSLELQVGPIRIDVDSENGLIVMTQKKPRFLRQYDSETIMPIFGLSPEDLLPGYPIQTVSTGTPQLMIPLKDQSALRRATMDHPAYSALRKISDFFSPHLFCLGGFTSQGQTSARHFGTPPDTIEDPFTGSATGGMAAYVWRYGLIETPVFVAEQGHWMGRPGHATVEIVGPRHDIETVRVGGTAVTVITGEMRI